MEIQKIIRKITITDTTMEQIKKLPCFRIVNGNGEIILDSNSMQVCCCNVAKMGDTLVEFFTHKWEVRHA